MIRVHHLENSRSHRVLWLLEELGQPYEVVAYQRDPKTLAAPAALRQRLCSTGCRSASPSRRTRCRSRSWSA